MLHRCWEWDYRERGIYLVTLTAFEHRPIFGELIGGEAKPEIRRSELGEIVARCWAEIPKRYSNVELLASMVMPDHFHGVLFVTALQKKPLGAIIRGFKAGVTKAAKDCAASMPECAASMPECAASMPRNRTLEMGPVAGHICPAFGVGHTCPAIWAPGYHDRILFRRGQLARMIDYVHDNPRRLAVKRAHPELFRVVRNLRLAGQAFSCIGNHFLLNSPVRLAIQCSRRISPEALEKQQNELLALARQGAVLISPCISPGEKQIARAALAEGLPLVVLLENGFPPIYKPPKNYFDACAEGWLLMMSPWEYHAGRRTITREQCLALNTYAKKFSTNEE